MRVAGRPGEENGVEYNGRAENKHSAISIRPWKRRRQAMKTFRSLTVAIALCLVPGLAVCASGPAPALATPPSPAEDGTMPALTAIAGAGIMDSHAYDELEDLSDNIGGRVTGSPQAAKAIQWGLARMRAIGLSNVHAEKWQLSHGWTRIPATAELPAPIQRH